MKILEIIFNIGSIAGLISLFIMIFASLRKKPKFSFDSLHFIGQVNSNEEKKYRFEFTGIIKNQSIEQNTIIRIYLVVWSNKKNYSTLRFGYHDLKIENLQTNQEIELPLSFLPREAKKLKIIYDIDYIGKDKELIEAIEPFKPSFSTFVYKYQYELVFEDINENYFDQFGKIINIDEKNLRWVIPNFLNGLQKGNSKPLSLHRRKIFKSRIKFRIKNFFQNIGIWK